MNDNEYPVMDGSHRLELDGRERLTITGVTDVERFDETCIVMQTTEGLLTVTGDGLHIDKLLPDTGELRVEGQVEQMTYEGDGEQPREGLLHRLFG